MQRERRALGATQVRAVGEQPGTFEAVVMNYGVVDDYDTIFDPGCFTESLNTRLPRITWSHDWSDPLGRYVDFKDTPETLTLIGEFDDFAAVPRARQAWAQLMSGTIDQFSVGFSDVSTELVEDVVHFTKATLDEAALVLVGAVPNTKLVSVRSAGSGLVREVPLETVIALAKKKSAGELTDDEAQAALELAAGGVQITPAAKDDATNTEAETVTDHEAAALLEDADATLDAIGA